MKPLSVICAPEVNESVFRFTLRISSDYKLERWDMMRMLGKTHYPKISIPHNHQVVERLKQSGLNETDWIVYFTDSEMLFYFTSESDAVTAKLIFSGL